MEATQTVPGMGQMARNPDGTIADMPHDLAYTLNSELMDVLALLRAAHHVVDSEEDDDNFFDASSATHNLLHMAEAKLRAGIESMSPYV